MTNGGLIGRKRRRDKLRLKATRIEIMHYVQFNIFPGVGPLVCPLPYDWFEPRCLLGVSIDVRWSLLYVANWMI
jgi:hypothetical protein